jgi:hypothetical protein
MRRVLAPFSLVVALAGCARSGDADVPTEAVPVVDEAPAAWSATAARPPLPEHEGPVRYQQLSMDVAAKDPTKAIAAARTLVVSLGGEIMQASVNEGQPGSLNASMPPQALERLRHGVGQMTIVVNSESSSTQDMTQHCDMLRDRLQQLGIAEAELEKIMRTTREPAVFEAMLVQRELGTRERDNLRQQLTQQIQQAQKAQFYLTVQPLGDGAGPDGPGVIRDPIRGWRREH